MLRKLATTAYGLVGTDYVRMTLADLDGSIVFVRADGSNQTVPFLPNVFRTSGDIVNVASTLGHRVNMAAVPKVGLPNHTWKGTFDLLAILTKFGNEDRYNDLVASYSVADEIAA